MLASWKGSNKPQIILANIWNVSKSFTPATIKWQVPFEANSGRHFFPSCMEYFQVLRASSNPGNWTGGGGSDGELIEISEG